MRPLPAPNPAEGVEVPYSALGFPLPTSRRSFPGTDPGPDAPDDRRPAFAVVPGRQRLVAERAVAMLEEVAATWAPDAARAVWDDEGATRERAALRIAVGYDAALCARLEAAKRLMLSRAAKVEPAGPALTEAEWEEQYGYPRSDDERS